MNNKTQSTIIAALMLTMFGQGCMKVELSPLDTNSATGVVAAAVAAPQILAMPTISYTGSPFTLPVNQSATLVPDVTGAPTSCASDITLPAGLTLDNLTCKITGSPTTVQAAASYTITASNDKGSASAVISIAVIATGTAPTLSYSGSPYTLYTGTAITPITPTVTGAPTSCTSGTALPAGLTIDNLSCVISGTPTIFKAAATYVITAANSFGSTLANIIIKVLQQMGGAILGGTHSTTPNVTAFAGAIPGTDGTSTAAIFNAPRGSVVVGGNLFVADTRSHTIRKIVIATGVVTTIAGQTSNSVLPSTDGIGTAATFNLPAGIATDGTSLFVTDFNWSKIRKITPTSGTLAAMTSANANVTTLVSTGLNRPRGITITPDFTTLYVTNQQGYTISKITISTGATSVVAGSGTNGFADGTGTAASFGFPEGIINDGTRLYVVDYGKHKIRLITPSAGTLSAMTSAEAVVTTLAGSTVGYADGAAGTATTTVQFNWPDGIVSDGTSLYVFDSMNHRIRKISNGGAVSTLTSANAVVSTFAGSGTPGYLDGTGTAARFFYSYGLSTDNTNIYVGELSGVIRKIAISTAAVSTLAGKAIGIDGTGTAATFGYLKHITTDRTNLYVADDHTFLIRKITIATGAVTTLAGQRFISSRVDGTGLSATFQGNVSSNLSGVSGITTDGNCIFVSENTAIRKIQPTAGVTLSNMTSANAVVTTIVGAAGFGTVDGTGNLAKVTTVHGITTDGSNLYFTQYSPPVVRKITPDPGVALCDMISTTSTVSTLAGTGTAGAVDATGLTASFGAPIGITTDGRSLFIADYTNHRIRQITPSSGTLSAMTSAEAVVTTLAGSTSGYLDGTGTAAVFFAPRTITTDGTNLYVAEELNKKIRKIEIATGVVTTHAGASSNTVGGFIDGAYNVAKFYTPAGITTDGVSIYVTDLDNHNIRKIQ